MGILGPEISPELEMDGPLMPPKPSEGAEKVGPLIGGLLKGELDAEPPEPGDPEGELP